MKLSDVYNFGHWKQGGGSGFDMSPPSLNDAVIGLHLSREGKLLFINLKNQKNQREAGAVIEILSKDVVISCKKLANVSAIIGMTFGNLLSVTF